MAIKHYKPTSPGRRFQSASTFEEITKAEPEKSLVHGKKRIAGRNRQGRISVRRRGGGHKRLFRLVDFRRDKDGVPAEVAAIEYDPNRSAYLALVHYADGEKRYILAAEGLRVGQKVLSGEEVDVRPGNCMPMRNIPLGTLVHNVEMQVGKGGQLIRGAGCSAQLLAKGGNWATLKLRSGEVRLLPLGCRATIGVVGNADHQNVSVGKAGRTRWLGRRPKVRGVAMNPHDHPHGGGEGKTSGGRHPVTPWGVPTKGYRTRRKKASDELILRRRRP